MTMSEYASLHETRTMGPATVVAAGPRTLEVLLPQSPQPVRARIAVPGMNAQTGDQVLVAGESLDELFVIGAFGSPKLRTPSGGVAETEGDVIRVRSVEGAVLFEYDAATKQSQLHAPDGDLAIVASNGGIRIQASRGVAIDGDRIEMRARKSVLAGVGATFGRLRSSITLTNRKLRLAAEEIDLVGKRAKLDLERTQLSGKSFDGNVDSTRWEGNRVEMRTDTVISTAKNVYRRVAGLSQLLCGRVRTIIDGDWDVHSKRTVLNSDDDVNIDGSEINLG